MNLYTDTQPAPIGAALTPGASASKASRDRRFAACLAAALLAMAGWLAFDQYTELRAWEEIRAAHGCPEKPTYQLDDGPNIPRQARGVWVCGDGTRWVR